jgi:hypothetical protein
MSKKFILIFLAVFFGILGFAKASLAATYYVRTDGSDTNNGSANDANRAFRTIQKCINTATTAGDTCSIMAGNYDENLTTKASGGSGNPITFISPSGYAKVYYIGVNHSYITINGFEFTGTTGYAQAIMLNRLNVSTPIEYITIRNSYFHDLPSVTYAIAAYLAPYPRYITIDNNIFGSGVYIGIGTLANIPGGNYSHNWTITNNIWQSFSGDSIRLFGYNHYVADNTMKFFLPEPSGSHTDAFFQSWSVSNTGLWDTIFENNKVMYARAQIGNVSDDGSHNVYNIIFRNNIFYAVSNPINYSGVLTNWYNNTFLFSNQGNGNHPILAWGSGYDNLTFKNNIFVSNAGPNQSALGYFSTPSGKTITTSNNLYAKYDPTWTGFSAVSSESGVKNGVNPKFKNAPKAATYAVWIPNNYDYNMEVFGNTQWKNCSTSYCGLSAIAPTTNQKSTSPVQGGTYSLHVVGNANSGVYRAAGWVGQGYYTVSAWVYINSGTVRLRVYRGGVNDYATITSTSVTGEWVRLSGSFQSDIWGMSGAPIIIDTTTNGAEWYIDDVNLTVNSLAANQLQYWKEYESFFVVGEYIEIQDDGVARKILTKDTGTNSITFSPALSVAPSEIFTVIESWGTNSINLTLDLSLKNDSPIIDAGANLSDVWSNAKDIFGMPRPQGTAWDIGAYEYAEAAPPPDTTPPSPPSGVVVQ